VSVSVSVCLSVCLPVCLPACLSVCLSACLPACLSICRVPSSAQAYTHTAAAAATAVVVGYTICGTTLRWVGATQAILPVGISVWGAIHDRFTPTAFYPTSTGLTIENNRFEGDFSGDLYPCAAVLARHSLRSSACLSLLWLFSRIDSTTIQ
jgi:hypothetical protein